MIGKQVLVPILALAILGFSREIRADYNYVANGNFASYTTGSNGPGEVVGTTSTGGTGGYTTVANWSSAYQMSGQVGANFLYTSGLADTTGSYYANPTGGGAYFKLWGPNDGSANGLTKTSPTGSNFIGLDGDSTYKGALSQSITGLVANHFYTLTFSWAAAEQQGYSQASSDFFSVSLGSQTQSTVTIQNAAEGFTGWQTATMTFKADAASDVLSFLSNSSPIGGPPFLLLSDISLTNAVPEPSSLIMLGLGLTGFVGLARRRTKLTFAATA